MKTFTYTARDLEGNKVSGDLTAESNDDVGSILLKKQLIPTTIKEVVKAKDVAFHFGPRVSPQDLSTFTKQMHALLSSGVSTVKALYGIAGTTQNKRLEEVLKEVAQTIEKGHSLSTALRSFPEVFNNLFISIITVGEQTGRIDNSFEQLTEYITKENATKRMIKKALSYPKFVMVAITIAMTVMNIFVIPTFASMFSKMGEDLPPMTKFLMSTSDMFINYWPWMLAGLISSVVAFKKWTVSDSGSLIWSKWKLKLPIIGPIINQATLARFSRSMSVMLSSGIPITQSISLTADAVDNPYVAKKLGELKRGVELGNSLKQMSTETKLFTPLILQMIAVGEETGKIDKLLLDASLYYEEEVANDVNNLSSKIEPIMLVIIGTMVLVLALGIFTPMWDMLGHMT